MSAPPQPQPVQPKVKSMVGPVVLYAIGLLAAVASGIGGVFSIRQDKKGLNLIFGLTAILSVALLSGAWAYASVEGKKQHTDLSNKQYDKDYAGPTVLYSVGVAVILASAVITLVGTGKRRPGNYNYAALGTLGGAVLSSGAWLWAARITPL